MEDASKGGMDEEVTEDPKEETRSMKRISSGTTLRRRAIDELDTDFLTTLEELDKRLYAVLSKTTRYRNILSHEIKRLRSGSAPEMVRALLLQWEPLRREIKRLAHDL